MELELTDEEIEEARRIYKTANKDATDVIIDYIDKTFPDISGSLQILAIRAFYENVVTGIFAATVVLSEGDLVADLQEINQVLHTIQEGLCQKIIANQTKENNTH